MRAAKCYSVGAVSAIDEQCPRSPPRSGAPRVNETSGSNLSGKEIETSVMTSPAPIALVVCDNIYRESGGKTALVGLFNRMAFPSFPAVHHRLCVYASVTDIRPQTRFRLDIVHSETDEKVASLAGPPPEGTDPTTICDLNFELRNLVFKEPGRYYIQFWGNDHMLLQRPFEVTQIEPQRNQLP